MSSQVLKRSAVAVTIAAVVWALTWFCSGAEVLHMELHQLLECLLPLL
jgi:hypothetical protein